MSNVELSTQNEITRPKAGTKTGRVWDISDELSEKIGSPAARKDVLIIAEGEGINQATASTQYGRWRKYHGLAAEPEAPKAPKVPKASKKVASEVVVEAA